MHHQDVRKHISLVKQVGVSVGICMLFTFVSCQRILQPNEAMSLEMVLIFFKEGVSTPGGSSSVVANCSIMKEFGSEILLPNGKRQLHRLGVMIRKEYATFLDRRINPTEMVLSAMKRAISLDSMFALLSGLLTDPRPITRAKDDPVLLPRFPIEPSIIKEIDFDSALPANQTVFNYKRYSRSEQVKDFSLFDLSSVSGECPNFRKYVGVESKDTDSLLKSYTEKESSSILESILKLKEYYPCITIGRDILAPDNLDDLTDFVNAMQYQNLTNTFKAGLPAYDVLERTRQVLYSLYEEKYYEKVYKLTASSSILELARLLRKKASGKTQNDDPYLEKLAVFSGSDNLLTSLLWVVGNLDASCYTRHLNNSANLDKCPKMPNFASNLIFELVRTTSDSFFVKVRYNGNYLRVCPLNPEIPIETLVKLGFPCELDEFLKIVIARIETDWRIACGVPTESTKDNYSQTVTLMVVFLIVFFVLTLLTVVFVMCYYTKASSHSVFTKSNSSFMGFDISFEDPQKRRTNDFKIVDRESMGRYKINM